MISGNKVSRKNKLANLFLLLAFETIIAKADKLIETCQGNLLDCYKSGIIVRTKWQFGSILRNYVAYLLKGNCFYGDEK